MEKVCETYENQKIYKILWHHSHNLGDYDKYIFVGPRSDDIKVILNELEVKGDLGSSNKKRLNNEIPFYERIFGEILPKNTFFIYHYIDDNTNIGHLQENICYLISDKHNLSSSKQSKLLPRFQYLWYQSKNINLDYYLELLNQIFINVRELKNVDFFERMENVMMLNKKEVGSLLLKLLASRR